jgi:hypothetical protein
MENGEELTNVEKLTKMYVRSPPTLLLEKQRSVQAGLLLYNGKILKHIQFCLLSSIFNSRRQTPYFSDHSRK